MSDALNQSARFQAKWEWSSDSRSGRWSNQQQAIKPMRVAGPSDELNADYQEVRQSKLKVRGQGSSLSVRYESEEGKDFSIFGWSIPYTGKTKV